MGKKNVIPDFDFDLSLMYESSIFDDTAFLFSGKVSGCSSTIESVVDENCTLSVDTDVDTDKECYLMREERIMSLAKEKATRLMAKYTPDDEELWRAAKKMYQQEGRALGWKVLYKYISPIFRKLLMQLEFDADGVCISKDLLSRLESLTGGTITCEKLPSCYTSYFSRSIRGYAKLLAKNPCIVSFTWNESIFFTAITNLPRHDECYVIRRDNTSIVDPASFFATRWVYKEVCCALRQLYSGTGPLFNNKDLPYPDYEGLLKNCMNMQFYALGLNVSNLEPKNCNFVYQKQESNLDELERREVSLLQEHAKSIEIVKGEPPSSEEIRSLLLERKEYFSSLAPADFLNEAVCSLPDLDLRRKYPWLFGILPSEGDLVEPCSKSLGGFFLLPNNWVPITRVLFEILPLITSCNCGELEFITEFRKEYTSNARAKSYQTMLNHSQKALAFMADNVLNEYFGLVEIDSECDVEKSSVIASEIQAVIDTYMPFLQQEGALEQNALRFRKLGNHKASGLYYPGVLSLCVDIRSPASFIHELGHLIDYFYNSLSLQPAFSSVLNRYIYLIEHSEEGKAAQGKVGKYNLKYYTKPTEVFARCFEMYCFRVLNIRNDLLATSYSSWEYPEDERLDGHIVNYFNNLFKEKKEKEGCA